MIELDPASFAGPIAVTLAYVVTYYGFQMRQLQVKLALTKAYAARGEKFDRYFGEDREMLAADRAVLNTVEHMGPFLSLLWLHAVFVDTFSATVAGTVYVVARAAYPFATGTRMGRGVRSAVFLSTAPGYLVLVYLAATLVWQLTA